MLWLQLRSSTSLFGARSRSTLCWSTQKGLSPNLLFSSPFFLSSETSCKFRQNSGWSLRLSLFSLHNSRKSASLINLKENRIISMQQIDDGQAADVAMRKKAEMIEAKLKEIYPKPPEGFLDHSDPFTLLVAVLLSAQCLDTTVNSVTPDLFRVAGTPQAMRDLGEEKIKPIIKRIGLYNAKARALARLSADICEKHGGNVPEDMEALEALAGVGHKTASVVMIQAFNKPAFPVDTHIHRLACRWGCGVPKSVPKTEEQLKSWFPDPNSWKNLHLRMILFGREYCPAKGHNMDECPICSFAATSESRALNRSSPNKFIGAPSHKNPYSIMSGLKGSEKKNSGKTRKRTKKEEANGQTVKGSRREKKELLDASGSAGEQISDANDAREKKSPMRTRSAKKRGASAVGISHGDTTEDALGEVSAETMSPVKSNSSKKICDGSAKEKNTRSFRKKIVESKIAKTSKPSTRKSPREVASPSNAEEKKAGATPKTKRRRIAKE